MGQTPLQTPIWDILFDFAQPETTLSHSHDRPHIRDALEVWCMCSRGMKIYPAAQYPGLRSGCERLQSGLRQVVIEGTRDQ